MSKLRFTMVVPLSILAIVALPSALAFSEGTGPKVTLKTAAGPLKKGDPIVMSSNNLVWITSGGNEECTSNVLTAEDKTNSVEKPSGVIGSYTMTGEEAGGACKTTTPFGPDKIESTNLPWKLKLTAKGVVQITTGEGSKTVRLVHTYPAAGGAKCTYSSKKVLAGFHVSASAVPLAVTVSKQVFQLEAGSTPGCVTVGEYSGTFSTTSKGEPVDVEVK